VRGRSEAGPLAVVWLIAAYSIVFGVLLIWLGFKLKGWAQPGAVTA
jgi:hypothetical protein